MKREANEKHIKTYDKELRLEELQMITKTQQVKMKQNEESLKLDLQNMQS